MKTQQWGNSDRTSLPFILDSTKHMAEEYFPPLSYERDLSGEYVSGNFNLLRAHANYIANRENGTSVDSPGRELEYDGHAEWEKESDGFYHVKYTEGPNDKLWMEEKDLNYLTRLAREGTLEQTEPAWKDVLSAWAPELKRITAITSVEAAIKAHAKIELKKQKVVEERAREAERQVQPTKQKPIEQKNEENKIQKKIRKKFKKATRKKRNAAAMTVSNDTLGTIDIAEANKNIKIVNPLQKNLKTYPFRPWEIQTLIDKKKEGEEYILFMPIPSFMQEILDWQTNKDYLKRGFEYEKNCYDYDTLDQLPYRAKMCTLSPYIPIKNRQKLLSGIIAKGSQVRQHWAITSLPKYKCVEQKIEIEVFGCGRKFRTETRRKELEAAENEQIRKDKIIYQKCIKYIKENKIEAAETYIQKYPIIVYLIDDQGHDILYYANFYGSKLSNFIKNFRQNIEQFWLIRNVRTKILSQLNKLIVDKKILPQKITYQGYDDYEQIKLLLSRFVTIELSYHCVGDKSAQIIASVLRNNNTLTNFNLAHNQIGAQGAEKIAAALRSNCMLTNLDLAWNRIEAQGAEKIAAALKSNTTLTELNLRSNQIGAQGAEKIAEALKSNTRLTKLGLSYNQIGDSGAVQIGEALISNRTLTNLDLKWNRIGNRGAEKIAETLKSNTTLTTLNLGNNQIGAQGAEKIAEALKSNTTLTSLDLCDNQIGAQGAEKIAEALKSNTTLTSLDLCDNQIGVQGAEKIAEALISNRTLTNLDLRWNRIGNRGAEKIAEALKSNTTLTSLDFWWWWNEIDYQKEINDLVKRNCTFRDNCIQSLKQNNLQQARQLLQQGVSANSVLLELTNNDIPQLKPIENLLILYNNNNLSVTSGIISKAIKNAQNKNHPDVVCFLQDFLQLLNERNIDADFSKELTVLKALKAKWQTDVDLKLERQLQEIEQKQAGKFTQGKNALQTQIEQLRESLAKTQSEAKADAQIIQRNMQENQIKFVSLQIQMKNLGKNHDQENIQRLLQDIRKEFKAQLDTENKAQQAEFNQKLEESIEVIATEINKKETDYLNEVSAITAIRECLDKNDKNYAENLHAFEAKLAQVEFNQEKLMEEYLVKQELLRKQRELCSYPELRYFYRSIQLKLIEVFLAMKTIASDMIDPPSNWKVKSLQKGIELAGSLIPIPGAGIAAQAVSASVGSAIQGASEGVGFFTQNKAQTRIEKQSAFIPTLMEIEIVAECVARELASRYEEQLFQLTPEGSKLLGECAIARMMNYLDDHLELLTLGSDAEQLRLLVVQQLISSPYKVKMKQGFWGLCNKQIPNKAGNSEWTESGVLTEPGIYCRVQNNSETFEERYYSGKMEIRLNPNSQSKPSFSIKTRPDKYGYRLGTVEEAERLGLTHDSKRITSEMTLRVEKQTKQMQEIQQEIKAGTKQKFHEQLSQLLLGGSNEEKQALVDQLQRRNNIWTNVNRHNVEEEKPDQAVQEQIAYLYQELAEQNQQLQQQMQQMMQQQNQQIMRMMQDLMSQQQRSQTSSSPKPQG